MTGLWHAQYKCPQGHVWARYVTVDGLPGAVSYEACPFCGVMADRAAVGRADGPVEKAA